MKQPLSFSKRRKKITAARMRRRVGIAVISLWSLMAVGSLWILAGGTQEERIWVARSDRSQQCAPKSGLKIEKARAELERAGVKILDGKLTDDGQVRMQVCGVPSGRMHSFLIWAVDLAKAQKLGFQVAKNGDRIRGSQGD